MFGLLIHNYAMLHHVQNIGYPHFVLLLSTFDRFAGYSLAFKNEFTSHLLNWGHSYFTNLLFTPNSPDCIVLFIRKFQFS